MLWPAQKKILMISGDDKLNFLFEAYLFSLCEVGLHGTNGPFNTTNVLGSILCETERGHMVIFWLLFFPTTGWKEEKWFIYKSFQAQNSVDKRTGRFWHLKLCHSEFHSHLQFHLQLWSPLPGSWSPWWLCGTSSLCNRNLSAKTHKGNKTNKN